MELEKIWSKILSQLKIFFVNFVNIPTHKKVGYILLLLPVIAVLLLFLFMIILTREAWFYNIFVIGVWRSFESSNTIPIFLGMMLIAGAFLIKDSKQ